MQMSILLKSSGALFTMLSAGGKVFLCLAGHVINVVWAEVVSIQQLTWRNQFLLVAQPNQD
jgi:hypothetical protein